MRRSSVYRNSGKEVHSSLLGEEVGWRVHSAKREEERDSPEEIRSRYTPTTSGGGGY